MPQPARPTHPTLTRRFATVGAVLACAFAVAACGGDDRSDQRKPLKLPPDFNLQLFNCADWNAADTALRSYVLERMHRIANDQVTGPGVQGRGSVLTNAQATRLFDTQCADPRARGFVLYKIYAFARGFRGGEPGT